MDYPTRTLLELAFAAHRVNKGYEKNTRRYSEDQPTTFSNKELVSFTVKKEIDSTAWIPDDFVPLTVTEADRQALASADKHMRRYTMLALGNLTDFERDIFSAYSSERMPVNRVGLVAYLPMFVERELAEKEYKLRLKADFSESVYITENITDSAEVEILKIIPLNNDLFGEPSYLHFGAIGKDLVCFAKKEMYSVGSIYDIVGRIKGQDKERETGLPMTRLNYVKLRKQSV